MIVKDPQQYDFLSTTEISKTISFVENHRELWGTPQDNGPNRIGNGPNFYTLGYPTYVPLFMLNRFSDILRDEPPANKMFREQLGWLYEKLIEFFENLLSAKVQLNTHSFSYPGFNIFLSNTDLKNSTGPFHADTDHLFFPWKKKLIGPHHISFTVILDLPAEGARFEWKEISYYAGLRLPKTKLSSMLEQAELRSLDYKRGSLMIHDGFYFHRIGPWQGKYPTDRRLSLQGNLVELDEGWELYW